MIDRRLFLKDLGKFGMAMVVVSACGRDAPLSTATAISTAPLATALGTGGSVSPTTTVTPSDSTAPTGPTTWERANLGFVSAYILVRSGEAVIVDTGPAGSAPAILDALARTGLDWSNVGHVVATHLHGDHVGSFSDVMIAADQASGYAGTADLASVRSPRPLTGLNDADRVFDLRVIATPGHTPGHIALLDERAGILMAGDSLNGTDGSGLVGANPQFTPNMAEADASVARLAGFDFSVVLVGHGGPVTAGGAALVGALVSG